MTHIYWPGAAGMLVPTGKQRPYRSTTYTDARPLGGTTLLAESEADAIARNWRIIRNAEQGGRCPAGYVVNVTVRPLSDGEYAAHITGAEVR